MAWREIADTYSQWKKENERNRGRQVGPSSLALSMMIGSISTAVLDSVRCLIP